MEKLTVVAMVGRGAQHIVGRLADGSLIKYPHRKGRIWDASDPKTVAGDLGIHAEYGIPIPETRVISRPVIDDGKSIIKAPYAIITEEIKGRVFRESDLADGGIREQIGKLTMDSLKIREKSGAAIDFLGGAAIGNFVRYLTEEKKPLRLGAYNVIIDSRNRINLIDTNLLDPARAPWPATSLIKGLIDLQNGLMAHVLQEPETKKRYLEGNPNPFVAGLADRMYKYSRNIEKRRSGLIQLQTA